MKELDTAMNAYLQHHYDAATDSEKKLFASLLEEQDPNIMRWLNAPETTSPYYSVIQKIRSTLTAES